MFAAVKEYIRQILSDVNDDFSSKRFVMIAGCICLFVGFWTGLIWHLSAPDNIVEAIKWMTGGGVAGVAAEKFGKPKVND